MTKARQNEVFLSTRRDGTICLRGKTNARYRYCMIGLREYEDGYRGWNMISFSTVRAPLEASVENRKKAGGSQYHEYQVVEFANHRSHSRKGA